MNAYILASRFLSASRVFYVAVDQSSVGGRMGFRGIVDEIFSEHEYYDLVAYEMSPALRTVVVFLVENLRRIIVAVARVGVLAFGCLRDAQISKDLGWFMVCADNV